MPMSALVPPVAAAPAGGPDLFDVPGFLSSTVAELLCGPLGESRHPTKGICAETPVVHDAGLNWDVFAVPVPPPQAVGHETGIYLEASRHLRLVARSCAEALSSPRVNTPRFQRRLESLSRGRSHEHLLRHLVRCELHGWAPDRPGLGGDQRGPGALPHAPDDADDLAAPLLLCSVIERTIFDLLHAGAPVSDATAPTNHRGEEATVPSLLRDMLAHGRIVAALPPHAAEWLALLFSPRCLNLRNLLW